MRRIWAVVAFLLFAGPAANGMEFREYNCRSSSEFDRVIVTLQAPSGEARTMTFMGGRKALLLEAREMYGVLDWKRIKALHLHARENSGETLLSIEHERPNGEVEVFDFGYIGADCLSGILSRFETRMKFIRSSRSKPAGISRGA